MSDGKKKKSREELGPSRRNDARQLNALRVHAEYSLEASVVAMLAHGRIFSSYARSRSLRAHFDPTSPDGGEVVALFFNVIQEMTETTPKLNSSTIKLPKSTRANRISTTRSLASERLMQGSVTALSNSSSQFKSCDVPRKFTHEL